jgi:preprotein translocase SecE subunit
MARDRQPHERDSDADLGDVNDADIGDVNDAADDLDFEFGSTNPPEPLGQALPEVTEARLAEEGKLPPRVGRRSAAARGEEIETDRDRDSDHKRKGIFGRAGDFLRASWSELQRVQWPDRRHVGQGTAVVLGFVIVAGAYLGLLDAIWSPLIQKIL